VCLQLYTRILSLLSREHGSGKCQSSVEWSIEYMFVFKIYYRVMTTLVPSIRCTDRTGYDQLDVVSAMANACIPQSGCE
jgi:hypothetical protein